MESGSEHEGIRELVEVTKAMSEGDFYREVQVRFQGELGRLAEYINKTRKNLQHLEPPVRATSERLPEASTQLQSVTQATEEATHRLLALVEKLLEDQERASTVIGRLKGQNGDTAVAVGELEHLVEGTKNNLLEIMTTLSFQDLTGQKIKKIVALVEEVEAKILELILSFGIQVDKQAHREDSSRKKEEMIQQLKEAQALKQDAVEDILKNLGFA